MKTVSFKGLLKTQESLLQAIEHEFRSVEPKLIPLLVTRYLYLGEIEVAYGGGWYI